MSGKTTKRVKHIPQRTCVGCKQVLAKRTLIRIVCTSQGVRIDPTGKTAGRGAYLHNSRTCWEQGLKGALAHSLKIQLTSDDIDYLKSYLATLSENSPE